MLSLTLITGAAWASEAVYLDTLARLVRASPSLRGQVYVEAAAQEEVTAAQAQRWPSPKFEIKREREKVNSQSVLSLEQPLWAGGRIDAGIDRARALQAGEVASGQQKFEDAMVEVVGLHLEWHHLGRRIAVQREALRAHEELSAMMGRRVEQKINPQADLSLAQSRTAQLAGEVAINESQRKQLENRLRQTLGEATSEVLALAQPALPSPAPSAWKAQALSRTPLNEQLKAAQAQAAAEIRQRQGAWWPRLSLRAEHIQQEPSFNTPKRDNRVFLQFSAEPGAGLSSLAAVRGAEAGLAAVVERGRATLLALQSQLDSAFDEQQAALARLPVSQQHVQGAREVAASYSRQFVAGKKSWLDVMNMTNEALRAELDLTDAEAQARSGWWRLRIRALGV